MSEFAVIVTYTVRRSVFVEASSKSEARRKAMAHYVTDVQDVWDLVPVSTSRAIKSEPIPDISNFKL